MRLETREVEVVGVTSRAREQKWIKFLTHEEKEEKQKRERDHQQERAADLASFSSSFRVTGPNKALCCVFLLILQLLFLSGNNNNQININGKLLDRQAFCVLCLNFEMLCKLN